MTSIKQRLTDWWLGYTAADLQRAKGKVARGIKLDDQEYHAFVSNACDDLSGVKRNTAARVG